MKKNNKNNSMNGTTPKGMILSLVLASALLAIPGTAIVSKAQADGIISLASSTKTRSIAVPLSKPTTFRTDATFSEIVVGDPEVAIVTPLTDQSFYVVGSRKGTTGIALFNENRELIGSLDVEVGPDTEKLNASLRAAVKDSGITAKTVNGNVVLSGKAKSVAQADNARAIAQKYDKNAIDALQVTASTQVQLEVRFIEAQRSKSKELGISLFGTKGNSGLASNGLVTSPAGSGLISGSLPFGEILTTLIGNGANINILLQALEKQGVARRLAEPNLVALSGDTASFLAGGEFPFPTSSGDDKVSVDFKKFGVGLEFTPTVLDNGLIHLEIEPEVSAIDTTNTVRFNNVEIPSLIVRRAKTTVELRDGQSFVLAGMLQTSGSYDVRKFPWLGDLPILGPLFRSASYRKNETDLVIIVTPRLVKPLTPGTKIASPLDSHAAPNEVDLFVDGNTEISRAKLRQVAEADSGVLPSGHILDF